MNPPTWRSNVPCQQQRPTCCARDPPGSSDVAGAGHEGLSTRQACCHDEQGCTPDCPAGPSLPSPPAKSGCVRTHRRHLHCGRQGSTCVTRNQLLAWAGLPRKPCRRDVCVQRCSAPQILALAASTGLMHGDIQGMIECMKQKKRPQVSRTAQTARRSRRRRPSLAPSRHGTGGHSAGFYTMATQHYLLETSEA